MCGRYALTSPLAVIAERFHVLWTPEIVPHYNITAGQTIPAVHETGQGRKLALLTLPAAIAAQYLSRLFSIMLAAVVLGMLFTGGGLALPHRPDLPAGSTIIPLVAGVTYLCSLVAGRLLRRTGFRHRKRPAGR